MASTACACARPPIPSARPALARCLKSPVPRPSFPRNGAVARIENGRIVAEVDLQGRVRFLDADGRLLLEEKWRQRDTVTKFWTVGTQDVRMISALGIAGREFKPVSGEVSRITVRFEAKPGERLFEWGSISSPISILRVVRWNWRNAIRKPACLLSCPARATACCGTAPRSET